MADDKTTKRLEFLDHVHGVLTRMQDIWDHGLDVDGNEFRRSGYDGEQELVYDKDGLVVRLWVELGDESLNGEISLFGIFDVIAVLRDDYCGASAFVLAELFLQVYRKCAQDPGMEWCRPWA